MSDIVIHVENIGKRYRIGEHERYLALRDLITRAATAPARLFRARKPSSPSSDASHFWALKDVSFDVRQGEVVGIIGRNGAGKTTLLKILSRVTKPTTGFADVRGRMGSLLEVGTGFHPELTGRENVLLSGAILGMSKTEILRKFDEIVAFAEVEKFIDTPVKHYSTGMQMRLAFAVAAHLEPEILLVDEVLSVGDLEFQKKCLGRMGKVAEGGRTIFFISHQMHQIRRLCERVYWMEGGRIRAEGPTATVAAAYETAMSAGTQVADDGSHQGKARFRRWQILDPGQNPANHLTTLGPVTFQFVAEVYRPLDLHDLGISLYDQERQLILVWSLGRMKLDPGTQEINCTVPTLPLRPGAYTWFAWMWDDRGFVDRWDGFPELVVATEDHQHPAASKRGLVNVPCSVELRQTSSVSV
jgi:lipopolysaccharide transport system ATP-binding protein